jgi:molybdate transport system permease protein
MPFVVQPLQNAFEGVGRDTLEVAATLGAAPMDAFLSIVLPMVRPAYVTAAILGFAHTVGEFGVVLMIGGSIPGETQVLSIAIYDHVESLQYAEAHTVAGLLVVVSFSLLLFVYSRKRRPGLLR